MVLVKGESRSQEARVHSAVCGPGGPGRVMRYREALPAERAWVLPLPSF